MVSSSIRLGEMVRLGPKGRALSDVTGGGGGGGGGTTGTRLADLTTSMDWMMGMDTAVGCRILDRRTTNGPVFFFFYINANYGIDGGGLSTRKRMR